MSSDDVVISARNLTKTYRIFPHASDRIKEALMFGHRRFHREFTALQDVSFEIKKGETVGIIGRNGSGKSTLLQLICGILKPTSGEVRVTGRVSALLELGSGFSPEFTGRENVYFQGAIMGIPQDEIDAKFDGIATFADIGEFIDQPVRTYSSGMYVRLAFAVAISVAPDVLVVDEALAVGDAKFQAKCFRRLEKLRNDGATILIVSHAIEQITRLSDMVLLLDQGQLVTAGEAGPAISRYLNLLFDGSTQDGISTAAHRGSGADLASFGAHDASERYHLRPAYNPHEYRWGDRGAVILDFLLQAGGATHVASIGHESKSVAVRLKVLFMRDVGRPVFGLTVKLQDGVTLCGVNSIGQEEISGARKVGELVFVEFLLSPHLVPGDYFISVGVVDGSGEEVIPLDRRYDSIHMKVDGHTRQFGIVDMSPSISVLAAREIDHLYGKNNG